RHRWPQGGSDVDLYEVLDQVVDLVRQRKRITYRLLQRQFALDEATLEDLKAELLFAHPQIADADGLGLIWTGEADVTPAPAPTPLHAPPPAETPVPQRLQRVPSPTPPRRHPLRRPNAASSPCCSVTWWTRPSSPVSSTRKTCGRWCGPIKTPVPRSSPALRGILRSISAMACWSTLAIRWPTKTMPSGRCESDWASWRPWTNSIPA